MVGVLVAAGVLLAATVFGLVRRHRDGRLRPRGKGTGVEERLDSTELGADLGERATLGPLALADRMRRDIVGLRERREQPPLRITHLGPIRQPVHPDLALVIPATTRIRMRPRNPLHRALKRLDHLRTPAMSPAEIPSAPSPRPASAASRSFCARCAI